MGLPEADHRRRIVGELLKNLENPQYFDQRMKPRNCVLFVPKIEITSQSTSDSNISGPEQVSIREQDIIVFTRHYG
jgi:hypothetical protein